MGLRAFLLIVCAFLVRPCVGMADTLDFVFSSVDASATFSIAEPLVSNDGYSASFGPVIGTVSAAVLGVGSEQDELSFFAGAPSSGEPFVLSLYNPRHIGGNDSDLDINEYGTAQLYTGSPLEAVFTPGTYTFSTGDVTLGYLSTYPSTSGDTLTITRVSDTPPPTTVPEPASLLLLGTGVATGIAMMRRRLLWG